MYLQSDSRAKRLQIAEVVQEGALGERGLGRGGVVTRRCMYTNTLTYTHTHTYIHTRTHSQTHTFLNRSASLNILPSCTLSLPSRSSTNLSIGCSPPIILCTNSSYLPKPYQPTHISHHHKNKTRAKQPIPNERISRCGRPVALNDYGLVDDRLLRRVDLGTHRHAKNEAQQNSPCVLVHRVAE